MVHFFTRVVFPTEPDDFEIMKSRKKRLDFTRILVIRVFFLHGGDNICNLYPLTVYSEDMAVFFFFVFSTASFCRVPDADFSHTD